MIKITKQVGRMVVSKYLYKFRSFRDKNHMAMLTGKELFFASPDKFNDPFDCSVPIRYDVFTKTEFVRHWTALYRRDFPKARDYQIRKMAKEFYIKSDHQVGERGWQNTRRKPSKK